MFVNAIGAVIPLVIIKYIALTPFEVLETTGHNYMYVVIGDVNVLVVIDTTGVKTADFSGMTEVDAFALTNESPAFIGRIDNIVIEEKV